MFFDRYLSILINRKQTKDLFEADATMEIGISRDRLETFVFWVTLTPIPGLHTY